MLSTIIDILFIVVGLVMMLFPKKVARYVNEQQKKYQLRLPRVIERSLDKQKQHNELLYKKMEARVINIGFRVNVVANILFGALFFAVGILSLLGMIHFR